MLFGCCFVFVVCFFVFLNNVHFHLMAAEMLVLLIVHKSYHFMSKIRKNDCLNTDLFIVFFRF